MHVKFVKVYNLTSWILIESDTKCVNRDRSIVREYHPWNMVWSTYSNLNFLISYEGKLEPKMDFGGKIASGNFVKHLHLLTKCVSIIETSLCVLQEYDFLNLNRNGFIMEHGQSSRMTKGVLNKVGKPLLCPFQNHLRS